MNKFISRKAAKVIGIVTLTAMSTIGMARSITVAVDGRNVEFSGTQPMKMGDHVMVPLRGVFERMGANVDWQESNQSIIAERGDTRVELKINENTAYINGKAIALNNPAIVQRGSTMVPIRFISESLGAYVDWDEASSMVNISTDPNNRFYGDSGINGNNNNGNNNRNNNNGNGNNNNRLTTLSVQPKGSVIPLKLDSTLDSKQAEVGDKFTATIDTHGGTDYFGLPQGTKVEGHVSFAQAKDGDQPGALGLIYDRLLLPDGR